MSDITTLLQLWDEAVESEGQPDQAVKPEAIGAGHYTVLFEKFHADTSEKDGVVRGIATVTFKIMDGEMADRQFKDTFWMTKSETARNIWSVGRLLLFASVLAGRTVTDKADAFEVIQDSAGDTVLTLDIASTTGRGNGKTYYNVNYLTRVDG